MLMIFYTCLNMLYTLYILHHCHRLYLTYSTTNMIVFSNNMSQILYSAMSPYIIQFLNSTWEAILGFSYYLFGRIIKCNIGSSIHSVYFVFKSNILCFSNFQILLCSKIIISDWSKKFHFLVNSLILMYQIIESNIHSHKKDTHQFIKSSSGLFLNSPYTFP